MPVRTRISAQISDDLHEQLVKTVARLSKLNNVELTKTDVIETALAVYCDPEHLGRRALDLDALRQRDELISQLSEISQVLKKHGGLFAYSLMRDVRIDHDELERNHKQMLKLADKVEMEMERLAAGE